MTYRAERPRTALAALGPLAGPVEFAFDAMRVAEEEMARRWPGREGEPVGAFVACRPRYDVLGGRATLLEAHVREILDRMAAGEDTRPGTAAECCAALSRLSERAPLRHEWYLAYVGAFALALGEGRALEVLGEDAAHDLESYRRSAQAAEVLARLRSELADPTRAAEGTT